MSLEPDSITKPLPRGKTVTIPVEWHDAYEELRRAAEDYVEDGVPIFPLRMALLKLRDLSSEVKP